MQSDPDTPAGQVTRLVLCLVAATATVSGQPLLAWDAAAPSESELNPARQWTAAKFTPPDPADKAEIWHITGLYQMWGEHRAG